MARMIWRVSVNTAKPPKLLVLIPKSSEFGPPSFAAAAAVFRPSAPSFCRSCLHPAPFALRETSSHLYPSCILRHQTAIYLAFTLGSLCRSFAICNIILSNFRPNHISGPCPRHFCPGTASSRPITLPEHDTSVHHSPDPNASVVFLVASPLDHEIFVRHLPMIHVADEWFL